MYTTLDPILTQKGTPRQKRNCFLTDCHNTREETDRLVTANVGLIYHMATLVMRNYPRADYDAIISDGFYALWRCAAAYDPMRGVKFSSLACGSIARQMYQCIKRDRERRGPTCTLDAYMSNTLADPHSLMSKIYDAEDHADVDAGLAILPDEREQTAYTMRASGARLHHIGAQLGKSKERARQILKRAVNHITDSVVATRIKRRSACMA